MTAGVCCHGIPKRSNGINPVINQIGCMIQVKYFDENLFSEFMVVGGGISKSNF